MADDFELTITIRAIDEASAVLDQIAAELATDFTAATTEAAAAGQGVSSNLAVAIPGFDQLTASAALSTSSLADFATGVQSAASAMEAAATSADDLQLAVAAFAELAAAPIFDPIIAGAQAASDGLDATSASVADLDSAVIQLAQDAAATAQALDQLAAAGSGLPAGASDLGQTLVLPSGLGADGSGFTDSGSSTGAGFFTSPDSSDPVPILQQQLDVMNQLLDVTRSQSAQQVVQNNSFNSSIDSTSVQDQIIPALERAANLGTTLL